MVIIGCGFRYLKRSRETALIDLVTPAEWVKAHRRAAVFLVSAAVFALTFVRVFILADRMDDGSVALEPVLRGVVDSLLATIFVSFVVAAFLWWLRSPLSRAHVGGEIFPDTIGRTLEAAASSCDEWEYIGHTGRYVRARILPILERRSVSENLPITIRFILINPFNAELCEQYAEYRTSSRSSSLTSQQWSGSMVRRELLTTMLRLIQSKAMYPRLQLFVGLSARFSLWRYDRSEHQVVVTQEDPQQPAYRYIRGSRFYTYFRHEGELAWQQSKKFPLDGGFQLRELKFEQVLLEFERAFGSEVPSVPEIRGELELCYRSLNNLEAPYV